MCASSGKRNSKANCDGCGKENNLHTVKLSDTLQYKAGEKIVFRCKHCPHIITVYGFVMSARRMEE